MAKLTPAEKQKRYRDHKKVTKVTGNAPEKVTRVTEDNPQNVTEQDAEQLVDVLEAQLEAMMDPTVDLLPHPLDVYSESRWSFLQSRGHIWNPERRRSFRPDGIMGVTVPGDPGYEVDLDDLQVDPSKTTVRYGSDGSVEINEVARLGMVG